MEYCSDIQRALLFLEQNAIDRTDDIYFGRSKS